MHEDIKDDFAQFLREKNRVMKKSWGARIVSFDEFAKLAAPNWGKIVATKRRFMIRSIRAISA